LVSFQSRLVVCVCPAGTPFCSFPRHNPTIYTSQNSRWESRSRHIALFEALRERVKVCSRCAERGNPRNECTSALILRTDCTSFCGEIVHVHALHGGTALCTRSAERLHMCSHSAERLHLCTRSAKILYMYTDSGERMNKCKYSAERMHKGIRSAERWRLCIHSAEMYIPSLDRLHMCTRSAERLHKCNLPVGRIHKCCLLTERVHTISTQNECTSVVSLWHNLKFGDHAMISPLTFTLIRPECNLRCKLQRS
jgi:hypothetical protein